MSIEVRSLTKTYGDFRISIDLSVDSDETLVLAGPSGCGKTTALQMMAGLIRPDSGDMIVEGRSMNDLPAWKRRIGIVFQDLALFPHLSVGGNVGYGPMIVHADRKERNAIIAASLAAVRLNGYANRGVDTLSGGERQRVAIARALAASPKALLMDEPFSSLDAPLRRALRAEFRELRSRERFPCVFVTHDREEAAAVGDRIAVMREGRIVECGLPGKLFNEPKTEFVARFLGSGSIVPILSFGSYSHGVTALRTELGGIEVPYPVSSEDALLIPQDAIVLTAPDSGRTAARARIVETGFEGDGIDITLETSETALRLHAKADRRSVPPRISETVGMAVDWSLVRLVSTAIGQEIETTKTATNP